MKNLPNNEEVKRIKRESLLNAAVEAYKFFYPNVAFNRTLYGLVEQVGFKPNEDIVVQDCHPNLVEPTANSDTPYGNVYTNTKNVGPVVFEIPKGLIIGAFQNANFRFIANLGYIGKDKGKGGKYLVLPPNYEGDIPEGYFVLRPETYFSLALIRAIPKQLSRAEAINLVSQMKIYPLNKKDEFIENNIIDISNKELWLTPAIFDGKFEYWKALKKMIDTDIAAKDSLPMYGMLKNLGIQKGIPFNPTDEMKELLVEAAKKGEEQSFVNSFLNDDPNRIVWEGKNWEWVVFGKDPDKYYYFDEYMDISLRERWFYQAAVESPAMFERKSTGGSLYWLGYKDSNGNYLEGKNTFKLRVKTPVPAKQFWSVTVYDLDTRSEIQTDQNNAVLSSLYDNLEEYADSEGYVDLYFGPEKPNDAKFWKKTNKGDKWFTYFRVYGGTPDVFNGNWSLENIEKI